MPVAMCANVEATLTRALTPNLVSITREVMGVSS